MMKKQSYSSSGSGSAKVESRSESSGTEFNTNSFKPFGITGVVLETTSSESLESDSVGSGIKSSESLKSYGTGLARMAVKAAMYI